ncbi:NAD(P)-dependent oxidoreductase [Jiella pacifica]|uniref:NAD-binding protein n=1 Tax=Jiella pacifica TaxID=2696469 RepID=A0A6N9SVS3_9HYPH|nr:NAD(P)-dependent oxidoreductase [Jiella pacifica]NDW03160.1 NAD-binding protein [Jiella pacifica]
MQSGSLGFIGLGTMGGAMARRLIAAGHQLVVADNNPEAVERLTSLGARAASTPAEVAASCSIVFLSLPTPDVVEAVVTAENGVAAGAGNAIVVDLSTTGSQVEFRIDAALKASGKSLVDCPISGGAEGAAAGTLALMAAGPADKLDAVQPYLEILGTCFRVGDTPGQGQILKVINNLMSTAALTITSEALVLGTKAGLDPDRMLEAINAGSGRNSASTSKFPKHVLPRTFDFGMSIKLSAKDARLCLEEAERLGVPMIVGTAVRQLLTLTRDHLGGDVDMTSVVKVVEEWAGVEVRGAAAKA